MKRLSYPTDLTDKEWAIIEPLIPPPSPGGRPRSADMREVLNAIFYVLRGGISWRMLPHDLPPWKTVYHYFRAWRIEGVWEDINRYCVNGCECSRGAIPPRVRRSSTASRLGLLKGGASFFTYATMRTIQINRSGSAAHMPWPFTR